MFKSAYRQIVTYWGAPSDNGWGVKTFTTPITMKCRWEDVVEHFINYKGEDQISRACIWVPQDVEQGGYLFLGESTAADPTVLDGAYEIRMTYTTPDMRNLQVERRVYL